MTDEKPRTDQLPPPRGQAEPRRRFLETTDERRIALGKLTTEEEARLAAEIEKLR
jgi:hypothetical protein